MQSGASLLPPFSYDSDTEWNTLIERHFPDIIHWQENTVSEDEDTSDSPAEKYRRISLPREWIKEQPIQALLDQGEYQSAFKQITALLYQSLNAEATQAFRFIHENNEYDFKTLLESLDERTLVECLQARDSIGNTLLHRAIILGRSWVIELLLNTPKYKQALPTSIWQNFSEECITQQVGVLMQTHSLGFEEAKQRCDATNHFGRTPLDEAILAGNLELVKKFIDYGLEFKCYWEGNNFGRFLEHPLVLALTHGQIPIIRLLIATEWGNSQKMNTYWLAYAIDHYRFPPLTLGLLCEEGSGIDFTKRNQNTDETLFACLLSVKMLGSFLEKIPNDSDYRSLDVGRQLLSKIGDFNFSNEKKIKSLRLVFNFYGQPLITHPNQQGQTWIRELASQNLDLLDSVAEKLFSVATQSSLTPATINKGKRQREESPSRTPSTLFSTPPASPSAETQGPEEYHQPEIKKRKENPVTDKSNVFK